MGGAPYQNDECTRKDEPQQNMNEIQDFSTSYDERDAQSMEQLIHETEQAMEIAFNNIEFILGNADFQEIESDFQNMEQMHVGLESMLDYLTEGDYDQLQQR